MTFLVASALTLPAVAQDHVLQRLESSPRHHEWVEVKAGDRTIHSFLAFPEISGKATAVVVIHENRGLTDWVRGVADQLAEAGYIAIAPDLLSGRAPGDGRTKDFETSDAAREAIGLLKPEEVVAALHAVADHVAKLPAANGKVAVAGYCWGGGQTFRFATQRPDLAAAFVFYGAFPHSREDLAAIRAPVYGFYGGDDARINATIPGTEALMKELGKKFEPVIYEGAGHGFLRAGEDPTGSEPNRKAREQAWARWKEILKGL
jgi:carboxymethylenebutenolidase